MGRLVVAGTGGGNKVGVPAILDRLVTAGEEVGVEVGRSDTRWVEVAVGTGRRGAAVSMIYFTGIVSGGEVVEISTCSTVSSPVPVNPSLTIKDHSAE